MLGQILLDNRDFDEVRKDCVYATKEVNNWLKHNAGDYGFEDYEILDHYFMGYTTCPDGMYHLAFQVEDDLDTLQMCPSEAADIISRHGVEYFAVEVLGL